MGRIINPESAGKIRSQLTRAIVAAIRELTRQADTGMAARDLVAFILLSLETISSSIEPSVEAWEKRDYWVKADKFRMEWAWTERITSNLRQALMDDRWDIIAKLVGEIAQKFHKIKVSDHHRMGTPWDGCWNQLLKRS